MAEPDFADLATSMRRPQAANTAPAEASAEPNFADLATSMRRSAPAQASAAAPDPNAEPDAPTWLGRRWQDIKGKQDPAYKDVPAYTGSYAARMGASAVTHDDAAYGDILASKLGDRLVRRFKDANGYDLIEYKGEGADADKTYRAYVNKPGLDRYDISRGLMSAVPYLLGGGAANALTTKLGVPALVNMVVQGTVAGGTKIGTEMASGPMGNKQPTDVVGVAGTALGGAASVPLAAGTSALWRRFVTEPSLFDRATGQLTAKGVQAAQQAGLDPQQLNGQVGKAFAREFSRTGDVTAAANQTISAQSGIKPTWGQLTKDPEQLWTEEAARRGIYGPGAKAKMLDAQEAQRGDIRNHLLGQTNSAGEPGMAAIVAPSRPATNGLMVNETNLLPSTNGAAIRDATTQAQDLAKMAEKARWKAADAAGPLTPRDEALKMLPDSLNAARVGDYVDSTLTPAATRMVKHLEGYIEGKAPQTVSSILKGNPDRSIQNVRKQLVFQMKGAETEPDKMAARRVYEAFDSWIDTAAAHIDGDPMAAAAMRLAKDGTRELEQLFAPRVGGGMTGPLTPGAKVIQKLTDEHASAEDIVKRLVGDGVQNPKSGTLEAVKILKSAYQRYLPAAEAEKALDNIRMAHWLHVIQAPKGTEALTPQRALTSLESALKNEASVMAEIYTPQQMAAIRSTKNLLEKLTFTPPNSSGTSYGVATWGKQLAQALSRAFGGETLIGRMLISSITKPIAAVHGDAIARRALSQGASASSNAMVAPAINAGMQSSRD